MILTLMIKNILVHRKNLEDEELETLLDEDSCQAEADLAESSRVDHSRIRND